MKCQGKGCKNQATVSILQNWDNKELHLCEDHSPIWVKQGKKESPVIPLFGERKSWYRLIN